MDDTFPLAELQSLASSEGKQSKCSVERSDEGPKQLEPVTAADGFKITQAAFSSLAPLTNCHTKPRKVSGMHQACRNNSNAFWWNLDIFCLCLRACSHSAIRVSQLSQFSDNAVDEEAFDLDFRTFPRKEDCSVELNFWIKTFSHYNTSLTKFIVRKNSTLKGHGRKTWTDFLGIVLLERRTRTCNRVYRKQAWCRSLPGMKFLETRRRGSFRIFLQFSSKYWIFCICI